MARQGEKLAGESGRQAAQAANAQNVANGFKPNQPVAATLCVEEGLHKEMGRAVFVQQGNHGCLLSGCTDERCKTDATSEALSVWAN
jgi:hypothetical protein